jgi:hypothetical protein
MEVEAVKIIRIAPGNIPAGFGGACCLVGIGDQVFTFAGYVAIGITEHWYGGIAQGFEVLKAVYDFFF